MGAKQDKLFLEIGGEPVIAHTWKRWDDSPRIDEIVLVARPEREALFRQLAERIQPKKTFRLVPGGARRQDSTWNGISAVAEAAELVAVHDGARPCVSESIIGHCFDAAERFGAVVAATPVTDTLKRVEDDHRIRRNVDRSDLWSVQTPQTFRRKILIDAMERARNDGAAITDEAGACELIGQPVFLVESRSPNPKVTVPADLPFVEWLITRG